MVVVLLLVKVDLLLVLELIFCYSLLLSEDVALVEVQFYLCWLLWSSGSHSLNRSLLADVLSLTLQQFFFVLALIVWLHVALCSYNLDGILLRLVWLVFFWVHSVYIETLMWRRPCALLLHALHFHDLHILQFRVFFSVFVLVHCPSDVFDRFRALQADYLFFFRLNVLYLRLDNVSGADLHGLVVDYLQFLW